MPSTCPEAAIHYSSALTICLMKLIWSSATPMHYAYMLLCSLPCTAAVAVKEGNRAQHTGLDEQLSLLIVILTGNCMPLVVELVRSQKLSAWLQCSHIFFSWCAHRVSNPDAIYGTCKQLPLPPPPPGSQTAELECGGT